MKSPLTPVAVSIIMVITLLWSVPSHACLGPMLEHTIFFTKPPEPAFDADVIAVVTVQDVQPSGVMKALVNKVKQGPIAVGDVVTIEYQISSCGPNHDAGEKGLIIAKSGKDMTGNMVLYPYTRSFSGDSTYPPKTAAGAAVAPAAQ